MFVSIDMQNLEFLHKHYKTSVLFNLAHVEVPKSFVKILDTVAAVRGLTELEKKMMVRKYAPDKLHENHEEVLCGYIDAMPVVDVDESELKLQASVIRPTDNHAYKYIKGAITKRKQPTAPPPLTPQAQNTTAPTVTLAMQQTPAITQIEQSEQYRQMTLKTRSSGVRDAIWEKADQMWEAAGKPTDLTTVLKLRKEIMNTLEEDGIKRNSASNELGKWQKQRLQ
jgi:hypothetical protein